MTLCTFSLEDLGPLCGVSNRNITHCSWINNNKYLWWQSKVKIFSKNSVLPWKPGHNMVNLYTVTNISVSRSQERNFDLQSSTLIKYKLTRGNCWGEDTIISHDAQLNIVWLHNRFGSPNKINCETKIVLPGTETFLKQKLHHAWSGARYVISTSWGKNLTRTRKSRPT